MDIEFPSSTAAAALDLLPSQECSATTQALLLEDAIDDDGSTITATSTNVQRVEPAVADLSECVSTNTSLLTTSTTDVSALAESVIAFDAPPLHQLPEDVVVAASAPPIVPALLVAARVQYPDLQHMQRELNALPDIEQLQLAQPQLAVDIVRPFTGDQMRELYDAQAELTAADAFEQQFLHVELGADYKRHVLHELLTKYALCRQTLRQNRMDVATVQADFERLAPQLWRREKRTVRYQATCADSVIVRGSEQYE